MHRVELKDRHWWQSFPYSPFVPNAPCGVERLFCHACALLFILFLMHRVELKGKTIDASNVVQLRFLMHRVELKVYPTRSRAGAWFAFLMHRVELKERKGKDSKT